MVQIWIVVWALSTDRCGSSFLAPLEAMMQTRESQGLPSADLLYVTHSWLGTGAWLQALLPLPYIGPKPAPSPFTP